jgi:hypothetical protein
MQIRDHHIETEITLGAYENKIPLPSVGLQWAHVFSLRGRAEEFEYLEQ